MEKSEKAARKRAKRHGIRDVGFTEPVPTVRPSKLSAKEPSAEKAPSDDSPTESED